MVEYQFNIDPEILYKIWDRLMLFGKVGVVIIIVVGIICFFKLLEYLRDSW